jgi:peptidoglycan/xylan/chitin deacetylase (PgdA/CDA1 family)
MGKKDLLAQVLQYSGVRSVLHAAGTWRGLVVLNYHRVGDPDGSLLDHGVWSASAAAFDDHLSRLARYCDVIGLKDLERALLDRRGRYALVTFDDGYRDNYEIAFPILRRHRLPAVFCLTSGFLDDQRVAWWDEIAWMIRSSRAAGLPENPWTGGPLEFDEPQRQHAIATLLTLFKRLPWEETEPLLDFLAGATGSGRCPVDVEGPTWMTWDMVREMRQAGMDIAGHTVTHPILARLSPEEQAFEVAQCKARIESELGEPIEGFSYPVGAPDCFDAVTQRCLERAGYRWAFSFSGGYAAAGQADPFNIPRVAVSPALSAARLDALLPHLFARR